MKLCGIDPGNNGAMCVLDSNNPAYTEYFDFKKSTPFDMAQWLHRQHVDQVWVEDVHSLYGMSAKSNFNFGKSLGYAEAVANIVTQNGAVFKVAPKKWQKAVGVTVKGSKLIKKQVAELVKQHYPLVSIHGPQGGLLDGRSDATMIAHYALYHS